MDPKFLDHPGQGVSDLQACYAHALAGLVKAGTDLDQVGTELNRAQITFCNAIDDYFHQLQLQIDNKDKAIRLLLEQKIETYSVMSRMQNELMKLKDENTTLRTRNDYLTGILNANPQEEFFPGNETFEVQDRTSGPPHNGTDHSAVIQDTSLKRRFASSLNGNHGRDTSELVPYRTEQKEQGWQSLDDEALESRKKSTKHICPGETPANPPLQDARERQIVVRERLNYGSENAKESMRDVIRQAQERLKHNPASTLAAEINSIRKEKTARERLAEAEEALPLVRESWKKSSTDTDPDATRAISHNTSSSDVLARRPQAREMESSNQGSTAQDPSQHHFHSQVSQQKNLQKASDQHLRAGDLNAGSWANYKQGSTTEAKESFRRQQATHGWTATTDDKRPKGSSANEIAEAIQPVGRVTKLKADLESSPRKDHSVSVLDPRSPSFVPSPDKRGAATTGRQTPPHKRFPKPDNLNADLTTASTIVNPAIVNSNLRNENSTPPHKRLPVAFGAHKTPEADTDLIALEDEIDPVTALRQYTFKATTRKDHTLAPLDPNTSKPLPTVPKDSKVGTDRVPAPSSLDLLKELQTEAGPFSPAYNAPLDPIISTKAPSQVRVERAYKQAHDSSEPSANPSSSSISPPAVENTPGAVQGLPLKENVKGVPVQGRSTPVLTSSPVRSETNEPAHSTANARTETRVIKTTANCNFDTSFKAGEIERELSTTFMAAALSKFSTFASKYGRDPESDTRKELAAKGRALKEKLANEASTSDVGASLREPEEQYRYPVEDSPRPPILGTHDLGGGLDDQAYNLVIQTDSRGEWFELDLDWKAVVKDGEIRYIL